MSLIDIKNYLMRVKVSSLASLCSFLNAEPDTLRQMLKLWILKGKVRQYTKTPACGSKCSSCPSDMTEIYEWLPAENSVIIIAI